VGAEGIAGEQRLVRGVIGVHGIRPVQVRQDHELQGAVAELQRIVLLDRDRLEIMIDDLLQEVDGGGCRHDLDLRIDLEQALDAAGMVRLRMVHDDVVDVLHVADGLQMRQILVKERRFGGLKQHRLLTALQEIGIVAGAVFRMHDDVERAQVKILDSDPP